MEETPENGKELSHSAHVSGMNEYTKQHYFVGSTPAFYLYLDTSFPD